MESCPQHRWFWSPGPTADRQQKKPDQPAQPQSYSPAFSYQTPHAAPTAQMPTANSRAHDPQSTAAHYLRPATATPRPARTAKHLQPQSKEASIQAQPQAARQTAVYASL